MGRRGLDLCSSGKGHVVDCCDRVNQLSGTLKCGEVLGSLKKKKLYRQSGRRWSAKLVPTFADRGVSRGQRSGSPRPFNLCFLDRSRYFLFK